MKDKPAREVFEHRDGLTPDSGARLSLGFRCLWIVLVLGGASVVSGYANSRSEREDISKSTGNIQIFLGFDDKTSLRLCIPSSLDRSILPENQSITFPLKPVSDGSMYFLHKREARSFAQVEQVRVAAVRTASLWAEVLGEMRASPEHEVMSGFVFKTTYRTGGLQRYVAVSSGVPVNLLISLRDDGASRELRHSQLASIASSITNFMKTKECN